MGGRLFIVHAHFPLGLSLRHPTVPDHPRVLAVLDSWWDGFKGAAGSRERASLLPRLYFEHFASTSHIAEHPDGRLAAFLVGFVSQTENESAYVHFAGVDPALHGHGVGRALYGVFFDHVRSLGCRRVRCVTSPGNAASRAFHTRLGFAESQPLPDYDGPGLDRIAFTLDLGGNAKPMLTLRVLEQVFTLEHHPAARHPTDDNWYALVRAPEGLTVIREADAGTPADERWLGVYDAEAGHGLDMPGLLSSVVHPLAEAAIPVFVASTYHADLVLIPESRRTDVLATLRAAGHQLNDVQTGGH